MNRADLRSVNLDTCRTCIILGAPGSSDKGVADETMVDKNVILATLNVRAMRFSKDEDVHYGSLEGGSFLKRVRHDIRRSSW